jgi:hypothetical protein
MMRKKGSLFGVLDYPVDNQLVEDVLKVGGWVLARSAGEIALEITLNGQPVPAAIHRTERADVARIHSRYAKNNPLPGFLAELNTQSLSSGRHHLVCTARQGKTSTVLGKAVIRVPDSSFADEDPDPDGLYWKSRGLLEPVGRLLLMHIPKTAGTSLNAYLEAQYAPENIVLHAENQILGKTREETRGLDEKHLLTAHLKLDTLARFIDSDRFFKVTVLRDPVRQTISHFGWVRRLADPENQKEFERSPDYIKRIVERMEKLDLVEFIDTMDRLEKNFFDNCQARYLLPFHGDVELEDAHLPAALRQLESFDLVGLTERFYDSLLMLSFSMGWPPPRKTPKLNTSSKRYMIDLENGSPELQDRFHQITRFDQAVYAHAEVLFQRQLRTMLKTLGRDHPGWAAALEDGTATPAAIYELLGQRSRAGRS